jgi:hypothetical protein
MLNAMNEEFTGYEKLLQVDLGIPKEKIKRTH